MAATYLNSTTCSVAIAKDDIEFTVAAVTNIAKGTLIVARGEAMLVREVNSTTLRVKVRRGYQGTRTLNHLSGATLYVGAPDAFKTVRDNAAAIVGDSGVLPDYCVPGTRAMDALGNAYVMVDLTASVKPGATVLISKDGNYTAAILTSSGIGPVGITTEDGTSDQWIWAQIYGPVAHAKLVIGSSLATSTGSLQGASSVSSPSVGLLAQTSSQASSSTNMQIYGMFLTSAATTASTAATSETGLYASVWLNYPYLQPRVQTT